MPTVNRWLIVRADSTMRVIQRKPLLRWDEVSFRLRLTVPHGWGEEIGTVDLTIPEGTVLVEPEEMETPAKEDADAATT